MAFGGTVAPIMGDKWSNQEISIHATFFVV
jgi:hypothetical protein